MKKITALCIALVFLSVNIGLAGGGPDAYGYTWKDNNDAGGPTYNWIDIVNEQPVTDLSDDNSSPNWIDMGFDFQYYWGTFNQVKIGSNGWIAFNNLSNIAHATPTTGFPAIPTAGDMNDNFVAPFLADLMFGSTVDAGNIGRAYYYTNLAKDTFIVS